MCFERFVKVVSIAIGLAVVSACDSNSSSSLGSSGSGSSGSGSSSSSSGAVDNDFSLQFKAKVGELDLNCNGQYDNLGPSNSYSVAVGDLRFYVSNLKFYDINSEEVAIELQDNDFQLNHEAGSVALIDLSSTDSGACEVAADTRGTARTNSVIVGRSSDSVITAVSFDVGVPQATMNAVVRVNADVSDAPSPLGEMEWNWAMGYRHFLMDFAMMDATHNDVLLNSLIHIGSHGCTSEGQSTLDEKDECSYLNTPKVWLDDFDLSTNTVVVDVTAILENLETGHFGTANEFGLKCHSRRDQSACAALFPNFGIDLETGESSAALNSVFVKE